MAVETSAPPVAAPVAAPAPAPVATPTTTPAATPAPVQPARQDPGSAPSLEEKVHTGWEAAKAKVEKELATATPEAAAAAVPGGGPAAVVPPVDKVDGVDAVDKVDAPADVTAAEAKPEEVKPADAKPGDQPAAVVDAGEVGSIDEFNKFLEGTPEFKTALDDPKNQPVKAMVYGALRRDQENRELRSIVPDVPTARSMRQGAAHWNKFDDRFLDSTTPDKANDFLKSMSAMALEYDDKGQPVLDDQGKYKMHPAFPTILNRIWDNKLAVVREEFSQSGKFDGPVAEIFGDGLKALETQAAQLGGDEGERLQAAVDIIRGVVPAAPAKVEVPPEVKERETAVAAREEASRREEAQRLEATHRESVERAETKASGTLLEQLKPILNRFGLQGKQAENARVEIGNRLDKALADDPYYQSIYDGIERRLQAAKDPAQREAIEKELTAHALLYANVHFPVIAAAVGREYAQPIIAAQDEREEKIAGQVDASRPDAKGVSVNVAPGKAPTPAGLRAQITQEWNTAHPGEDMPEGHMIREMKNRSGIFAKA